MSRSRSRITLSEIADEEEGEPLTALDEAIERYHETGQLTPLMNVRDDLRRSVLDRPFEGGERDALQRCAAGELGLWLLDVPRTGECLRGLFEVDDKNRVRAIPQSADRLRRISPVYAGRLVSIASQLQYRLHTALDQGLALVDEAKEFLKNGEGDAPLWGLKNEIVRSRLLYRAGSQSDAQHNLSDTILALREQYAVSRTKWGSLDIALGMACEIYASMLTTKGELDASMRLVLEALQLLGGYPARDPVRRSYAAMTGSRISSGYGREHAIMALRYAQQAVEGFTRMEHPFGARARVQLARCWIKLRDFAAAKKELQHIKEVLPGIENRDEQSFARTEFELTWARFHQALARTSSNTKRGEHWKRAAKAARNAERIVRIPDRIRSDAMLRAGQAMLETGAAAGEERVRKAIDLARESGRVKVVVAGHLVLAEHLHRRKEDHQAIALLETAHELLGQIESEALHLWLARISALLDQPIRVQVPKGGLVNAEKAIREKLLLYFWERSQGKKDRFEELARVGKGIYYDAQKLAKGRKSPQG